MADRRRSTATRTNPEPAPPSRSGAFHNFAVAAGASSPGQHQTLLHSSSFGIYQSFKLKISSEWMQLQPFNSTHKKCGLFDVKADKKMLININEFFVTFF